MAACNLGISALCGRGVLAKSSFATSPMSALGQNRPFGPALPSVCFAPKADIDASMDRLPNAASQYCLLTQSFAQDLTG